jgi:hypothetical protein
MIWRPDLPIWQSLPTRSMDANLDRCVGLRSGCHRQKAAESGGLSLHTLMQVSVFEKMPIQSAFSPETDNSDCIGEIGHW